MNRCNWILSHSWLYSSYQYIDSQLIFLWFAYRSTRFFSVKRSYQWKLIQNSCICCWIDNSLSKASEGWAFLTGGDSSPPTSSQLQTQTFNHLPKIMKSLTLWYFILSTSAFSGFPATLKFSWGSFSTLYSSGLALKDGTIMRDAFSSFCCCWWFWWNWG